MVEKPTVEDRPSDVVATGCYLLDRAVLALSAISLPAKAENCSLPSHRSPHLRGRLRPPSWSMMATRDLGNPGGFIPASVEFSLRHSEYGPALFHDLEAITETTGWSETRRRKRQYRPRPQPCPCRSLNGPSLATRVKVRKCGQSRIQDWDRGVRGGVANRPLLLCPGSNELPRRVQCLAEAAEFRFTSVGLLYGPESLRVKGGRLMEGRCAGAGEGGDAGGCAKQHAAGRPHRVPLRGRAWRGLRLKSTGLLWAGWKGASASEAVAEYSMGSRAKTSARRGCCGSRA